MIMKKNSQKSGAGVTGSCERLECLKPGVERFWLLLVAGLLWSVVGLVLCGLASYWFSTLEWPVNGLVALAGFGVGVLAHVLLFSRIAAKNIERISRQPLRVCLFAFQAWRSYLLIVVMMALGFTLRHSHLPRLILAAIYLVIGTALTLASSLYYDQL
jgi:hypothetical protein